MALVFKDRVKETTSTTGTGTVTLTGASTGFQSFSVIGDGNTTYYTIINGDNWEVGLGTYTASGTTLSRDTILESSNSGSALNLSGDSDVFCTYPAEKAVIQDLQGGGFAPHLQAADGIICHNSTIQSSYTIPAGHNAFSVGPITVASGVTVTVPTGQRWYVV